MQNSPLISASVPVVYLAGGMKSRWQETVIQAVRGVIFIDPRQHGLSQEADYTAWDLAGVERCDLVFGFMEGDNPGGAGLAVEFGWGARAGKHLILVEAEAYAQKRYFGMVRALATQRFSDMTAALPPLELGIRALGQFRDAWKAARAAEASIS